MKERFMKGGRPAIVAMVAALVFCEIMGAAQAELVGHWTLDNDTTGLTNLGTDGATSDLAVMGESFPTYSATGGFDGGGYATFTGAEGLVAQAPGNAAEDISAAGGYPFTFAVWARIPVPAPTEGRGTAMAISNAAAGNQYMQMGVGYLEAENGDFEVNRRNPDFVGLDAVGSAATLADGDWHHFAAVLTNDSLVELYLDGVLANTGADPVPYPTDINAVSIGAFLRNNTVVTDSFQGDVDEARLYNTALTAQEIAELAGVPTVVPGDFDGDGDVDGADFVVWQTNFPTQENATLSTGDADGDGDVDGADFVIWQTNFPFTPGSSASPVPEPNASVLALLGFSSGLFIRRAWQGNRRINP